jgi:hypothetical protein
MDIVVFMLSPRVVGLNCVAIGLQMLLNQAAME